MAKKKKKEFPSFVPLSIIMLGDTTLLLKCQRSAVKNELATSSAMTVPVYLLSVLEVFSLLPNIQFTVE